MRKFLAAVFEVALVCGLVAGAACAMQERKPGPPCPERCKVHWTSREWSMVTSGKVTSGAWTYVDHYECDARCAATPEVTACP